MTQRSTLPVDWYVNVGMDDPRKPALMDHPTKPEQYVRNWDLCVKYGYIAAGSGPWYSKSIQKLRVEDRIFAYQKRAGYVGVGIVKSLAKPIHQLEIVPGRTLAQTLSVTFNDRRTPEMWEYAARVEWLATRTLEEAYLPPVPFYSQHVCCQPKDKRAFAAVLVAFGLTGGSEEAASV